MAASRREGDLQLTGTMRVLGHPLPLGGIYLLALASMLLHGLVIWAHPLERAAALIASSVTLGLNAAVAGLGIFRPRAR